MSIYILIKLGSKKISDKKFQSPERSQNLVGMGVAIKVWVELLKNMSLFSGKVPWKSQREWKCPMLPGLCSLMSVDTHTMSAFCYNLSTPGFTSYYPWEGGFVSCKGSSCGEYLASTHLANFLMYPHHQWFFQDECIIHYYCGCTLSQYLNWVNTFWMRLKIRKLAHKNQTYSMDQLGWWP